MDFVRDTGFTLIIPPRASCAAVGASTGSVFVEEAVALLPDCPGGTTGTASLAGAALTPEGVPNKRANVLFADAPQPAITNDPRITTIGFGLISARPAMLLLLRIKARSIRRRRQTATS